MACKNQQRMGLFFSEEVELLSDFDCPSGISLLLNADTYINIAIWLIIMMLIKIKKNYIILVYCALIQTVLNLSNI